MNTFTANPRRETLLKTYLKKRYAPPNTIQKHFGYNRWAQAMDFQTFSYTFRRWGPFSYFFLKGSRGWELWQKCAFPNPFNWAPAHWAYSCGPRWAHPVPRKSIGPIWNHLFPLGSRSPFKKPSKIIYSYISLIQPCIWDDIFGLRTLGHIGPTQQGPMSMTLIPGPLGSSGPILILMCLVVRGKGGCARWAHGVW